MREGYATLAVFVLAAMRARVPAAVLPARRATRLDALEAVQHA